MMTNPGDFRSVPPTVAPDGEDHTLKRVLASSQSGSLLDREARELLGRFQYDKNLPAAIRERAGEALRGGGTLRDVMETPEFTEIRAEAAKRFQEELAAMSAEEKEKMMRTLRERFSGPFGLPTTGAGE